MARFVLTSVQVGTGPGMRRRPKGRGAADIVGRYRRAHEFEGKSRTACLRVCNLRTGENC